MTKFLLISQGRSGSTKTFESILQALGHMNGIKEFQQLTPEQYKEESWKQVPAICTLTDPVFMQNKRKRTMINQIIKHCLNEDYNIVGLFRENILKRNISRQYAYAKNDWSYSNKSSVKKWSLDIDDIILRVKEEEDHHPALMKLISGVIPPENMLSFERIFEKDEPTSIVLGGKKISLNFYKESYLSDQKNVILNISNLEDLPKEMIEKYPLF